jgi:hypothetical protein
MWEDNPLILVAGVGAMPIDKYFVVRHRGEWTIKHNGRYSVHYPTQKQAIQGAITRAKRTEGRGKNAQVLVQDQHHTFRTEWTYGKDAYPPIG